MVEQVINELGLDKNSQGEGGIVYAMLTLLSATSPGLSGPNAYRAVLAHLESEYPSTANRIVRRVFGSRAF